MQDISIALCIVLLSWRKGSYSFYSIATFDLEDFNIITRNYSLSHNLQETLASWQTIVRLLQILIFHVMHVTKMWGKTFITFLCLVAENKIFLGKTSFQHNELFLEFRHMPKVEKSNGKFLLQVINRLTLKHSRVPLCMTLNFFWYIGYEQFEQV